eukprot:TRINITY_DN67267_c0_g1_i1.p1 TRINITY_DN67267_c0_g1~~TRINITY_DN67267_c0_g1_i1.p1  ORF type:complete len:681 (+),score=133.31 TRINITY_DN67267_c0_g1_i1:52-2043(+)
MLASAVVVSDGAADGVHDGNSAWAVPYSEGHREAAPLMAQAVPMPHGKAHSLPVAEAVGLPMAVPVEEDPSKHATADRSAASGDSFVLPSNVEVPMLSMSLTQPPQELPPQLQADFEADSGLLGEGAYAAVRKLRNRATGELAALKVVQKHPLAIRNMLPQLQREVKIQGALRHPRILRLIMCVEDEYYVYMLLEFCAGGSLRSLSCHVPMQRFPEPRAAKYFAQILQGVDFMHQCHCVHRDLKPDNILLTGHDEVKICDFGWSAECQIEHTLRTTCGTPNYWAPEIFEGVAQGTPVDLWALGNLVYELLVGHAPFWGNTDELREKVLSVDLRYPPGLLSNEAINLFFCLLHREPWSRIPAGRLLAEHPWVRVGLSAAPPLGQCAADAQETGNWYAEQPEQEEVAPAPQQVTQQAPQQSPQQVPQQEPPCTDFRKQPENAVGYDTPAKTTAATGETDSEEEYGLEVPVYTNVNLHLRGAVLCEVVNWAWPRLEADPAPAGLAQYVQAFPLKAPSTVLLATPVAEAVARAVPVPPGGGGLRATTAWPVAQPAWRPRNQQEIPVETGPAPVPTQARPMDPTLQVERGGEEGKRRRRRPCPGSSSDDGTDEEAAATGDIARALDKVATNGGSRSDDEDGKVAEKREAVGTSAPVPAAQIVIRRSAV